MAACLIGFLAQTPALATVVVLAPHPDDAEASCGGLIANTVAAGEGVVILTMTGGELGVPGKGMAEARALRAEEARKAAAVLGAKVEFFGAVDGSLAVDSAGTGKLIEILARLDPSLVLAPWPLDVHPDHQASGLLAWRAFQDGRARFRLYFYETCNSPHTTSFQFVPTEYVDVTGVMKKKQDATYQHRSQGPAEWLEQYTALARVRGYESDVAFAEGYVRARNSSGLGGRAGGAAMTLPPSR
jgi:LmbE family N-acetylglucosaminyl deacetylase